MTNALADTMARDGGFRFENGRLYFGSDADGVELVTVGPDWQRQPMTSLEPDMLQQLRVIYGTVYMTYMIDPYDTSRTANTVRPIRFSVPLLAQMMSENPSSVAVPDAAGKVLAALRNLGRVYAVTPDGSWLSLAVPAAYDENNGTIEIVCPYADWMMSRDANYRKGQKRYLTVDDILDREPELPFSHAFAAKLSVRDGRLCVNKQGKSMSWPIVRVPKDAPMDNRSMNISSLQLLFTVFVVNIFNTKDHENRICRLRVPVTELDSLAKTGNKDGGIERVVEKIQQYNGVYCLVNGAYYPLFQVFEYDAGYGEVTISSPALYALTRGDLNDVCIPVED